jgi:hypothetical protein
LIDFSNGFCLGQRNAQSPIFLGGKTPEAPVVCRPLHSSSRIGLKDSFRYGVGQGVRAGRSYG